MTLAAGGAAPRPPLSRFPRLSQPSYFLLLLFSALKPALQHLDRWAFVSGGSRWYVQRRGVSADVESLSSAVFTEARCLFVVTGLRHSVVHAALADFHTAALRSACHSCTRVYLLILHQPVKRSSLRRRWFHVSPKAVSHSQVSMSCAARQPNHGKTPSVQTRNPSLLPGTWHLTNAAHPQVLFAKV